MKTIGKLLGLGLVLLALWGCNSSTQSQNPATTTAQTTPEKRPFITKWKGVAGSTLYIPIVGTYTLTWYNEATPNERHTEQVSVKTEEGEGSQYSGAYVVSPYTLTPPTDGVYVVEAGPEGVEGMLMVFDLSETTAPNLLTVAQFGDVVWKQLTDAYYGCSNMQFAKDIDAPNLSQCTNLTGMFTDCAAFNSPLEHWDVSHVTNMCSMFSGCRSFNQPLNGWNVGKVSDMSGLFYGCEQFNQPLDKWDVSSVTKMNDLFVNCAAFNQPLASWNVSNVTTMEWMFKGCSSFNQPLNTWDVSKVEKMSIMFGNCSAFNQSLDAWEIGNVFKEDGLLGIFSNCPAGKLPFVKAWEKAGYNLELSEEERDENRDVPYGN